MPDLDNDLFYVQGRRLDYPVFDADNHMYENTDALTQHIPLEYEGIVAYAKINNRDKLVLGDRISRNIVNPTFIRVAPPGGQADDPEKRRAINGLAAFQDVEPRYELMQELGIDRALMFPTLASGIEDCMYDDAEGMAVVMHALNVWMAEHWTFNFKNSVFATPYINLADVDNAIKELEFAADNGAKAIDLRPCPVDVPGKGRRSFALPMFDPFWEAVQEKDILIAMHVGVDSRYQANLNDLEGPPRRYLKTPMGSPAFRMLAQTTSQITDVCASMIGHGLLTRFPKLKFAVVEITPQWVKPFFEKMERAWEAAPHVFDENPIDQFRRNIFVHVFRDTHPVETSKILGIDNTMFGSDFPHPEGLRDPLDFDDLLKDLSKDDAAKVMGGNLARILGVDITPVAAGV